MGLCLIVVFTLIIRFTLCKTAKLKCDKLKKIFLLILKVFLYVLSLDYCCAKCSKNRIKKEYKQDKKQRAAELSKYIKRANCVNFIFSFCIVLIVIILTFTNCNTLHSFLFGIIAYRCLSRTLEVNISFLKDCLEKGKNSDLTKYDRIKLAFISLAEEAFLFTGIYIFAFSKADWWKSILGGLHSFILSPYNVCQKNVLGIILSFVAVYQVICSIILITISFANYISKRK